MGTTTALTRRTSSIVATVALVLTTVTLVGGPAAADGSSTAELDGQLAAAYTVEILDPTNDGVSAAALGINNAGDVVGITRPTSSAQPQRTVLWERHDDHFDAHELANLEGSQFSRGFDVNDARTVVGEAFSSTGGSIPIRWDDAGEPQHVTSLNEAGTGILNDINDAGVVAATASGRAHLVAPDGAVTTLPAPDAGVEGATVNSYGATSIADGDVVGGRTSIAVPHGDHSHNELRGVVWDADGARLLETPEGGSSPTVAAVTADGHAVGSARLGTIESAVLWAPDGTPAVLTTPVVADYAHASARAVSAGVAVGYVAKFAGNTSFGGAATAWDADGGIDLNTRVEDLPEGVTLQTASDINDAGQIVGTATSGQGARGFVLTPVGDEGAEPVATTVTAAPVRQVYGKVARVHVEVSPSATGPVTLTAGDATVTRTLTESTAVLPIPARALEPGRRTVRVSYAGVPGEFAPASTRVRVRVVKAAVRTRVVRVKPEGRTVRPGDRVVLRVVTRAAGVTPTGEVAVRTAGRTRRITLARGRATVRVAVPRDARPGRRVVRLRYLGDAHVEKGALRRVAFRVVR